MLAANSIPFPVFDKNFFPKPPRENPGTFNTLRKFFDAYIPFLGQGHLTQTQFSVLSHLVACADSQTGHCFPKRQSIAKEIGVDPVTISNATAQLQELGIIAKFGGGGFSASCDYIVLFSAEAFALAALIESGKIDRFRLRHRDMSLPIDLGEEPIEDEASLCNPEITGSCNPRITRNELVQKNDYMASVDTQAEDQEVPRPEQAKRSGPRTPRLRALPEHWINDAKQKRPDLDIKHVASKFLEYHCKRGVRATANWYAAWIRWVERENVALDRRSTPKAKPSAQAKCAQSPLQTPPHSPQTGTSEPPQQQITTPARVPSASAAHDATTGTPPPAPRPRTKPPVRLMDLLKRRVKPESSLPIPLGTQAQETPQKPPETPGAVFAGRGDSENQRRWQEIMARVEARAPQKRPPD